MLSSMARRLVVLLRAEAEKAEKPPAPALPA
jgi:hypothetical protein